jgi:hypothetical protein
MFVQHFHYFLQQENMSFDQDHNTKSNVSEVQRNNILWRTFIHKQYLHVRREVIYKKEQPYNYRI